MIDTKKAQEQIREQRQILESQRKSIREEESGIEQTKIYLTKEQEKLPKPTQRLLRSKTNTTTSSFWNVCRTWR